jgi:phosphoketolase
MAASVKHAPVEAFARPAMDATCINTIRTLARDAVQAANSGHPGTPMALAPVVYCLWQDFLAGLKVRVINVVNLMKLQPREEHPHGLSDQEFDVLFTTDKPIIFAFHGYPWLIHRLTYRRNNHRNLHVRDRTIAEYAAEIWNTKPCPVP